MILTGEAPPCSLAEAHAVRMPYLGLAAALFVLAGALATFKLPTIPSAEGEGSRSSFLDALRVMGARHPWDHLIVGRVGGWGLLLVKRVAFTEEEKIRVLDYFRGHHVEVAYAPGTPGTAQEWRTFSACNWPVRDSGWSIPRAFLKSSHCEADQRTSVIVNFPSERPRSVMVAPFLPGDFLMSIECSPPACNTRDLTL